jgi:hypothetical protein
MNIEFSTEEYETLLKTIYMSKWMMTAYTTKEGKEAYEETRFFDLEQKILSLAEDFGCSEDVHRISEDELTFSDKYQDDSPVMEWIEIFEDEFFWEELIFRLSSRDFVNEYGDSIQSMAIEERLEKEAVFVEKYTKEFEEMGLDRLIISPK